MAQTIKIKIIERNQTMGFFLTRKPYRVNIDKMIFYEIGINIFSKCLLQRY